MHHVCAYRITNHSSNDLDTIVVIVFRRRRRRTPRARPDIDDEHHARIPRRHVHHSYEMPPRRAAHRGRRALPSVVVLVLSV
jgi:hypothetical protein